MRRALRASRGRPVPGVALHGRLPGSLVLACFLSLGEFVLLIKASCTASQGRSAQKSVGWSCRVRQAISQRSFTRPARGGKVEALLVLEHRAVPKRAAQPFNQPDCLRQPVISNVGHHVESPCFSISTAFAQRRLKCTRSSRPSVRARNSNCSAGLVFTGFAMSACALRCLAWPPLG